MEQTERSPSPPLKGHSDDPWDSGRDSNRPNGHGPLPRIPTKPGSRYVQQNLSTSNNVKRESSTTGSNSDSEEQVIKEELSADASGTSSTPNAAQQQPKQKSPSKRPQKAPVQLIPDCPRAEEAALKTFEELETNWHQYKYLGKSKVQEDAMACECQFKPGDPLDRACGPHSDCINRLTQVECVDGECRCRQFCQNQRFQKRQYANLHVVKTELKGFGLRAASSISRDDFIYEYIGEVVNENTLHRRMEQYGDEGLEHFYFMMLQKDEFIDATKKGGIGRFANHSCNPNCYVARWVVDGRLRMGIFAKRDVQKDEELTFNYNADRYGHEAQKCYCGEPNCIGFIGGKTQTDIGGMDDLYIDALGIADEVESLGLKGSRKKKGKKLDEDFTPVLKPMVEPDVPKVVNAIRQTSSRNILTKLIERIKLTDDQAVLRQVIRLRALSLMTSTLTEYKEDPEVQILILETISKWPFVNRTKIEDSKIEPIITDLSRSEELSIGSTSERLLSSWSTLETVWRIPKKEADEEGNTPNIIEAEKDDADDRPTKRVKREEPALSIKPLGVVRSAGVAATTPFRKDSSVTTTTPATPIVSNQPSRGSLSQIIEQAMEGARRLQEEEAAKEAAAAAEEKRVAEEKALRKQKAKEKAEKHKRHKEKGKSSTKGHSSKVKEQQNNGASSSQDGEKIMSNKEKQLHKLISGAVVGYLSQFRSSFESSEAFKEHAKKITQKIADSEKQGHTYKSGARLESLSEEKRAKIKNYVKGYVGKMKKSTSTANSKDPRKHLVQQPAKSGPDSTTESPRPTDAQDLDQIAASPDSELENKMSTDDSDSGSDTDGGDMETEEVVDSIPIANGEMMDVDS